MNYAEQYDPENKTVASQLGSELQVAAQVMEIDPVVPDSDVFIEDQQ